MASFPGSFPGAQPAGASNQANFPGTGPAAATNPAYFPGTQPAGGPLPGNFPGAQSTSNPFQASFPASQATFPGAQGFNPPQFPGGTQASIPANFAGTLPAATQPPGTLPAAQDPSKEAPAFVRNPALLGPPPLVQIYPPIIKPSVDLYIEETHYIVSFT